jgi:hypothetical protein
MRRASSRVSSLAAERRPGFADIKQIVNPNS